MRKLKGGNYVEQYFSYACFFIPVSGADWLFSRDVFYSQGRHHNHRQNRQLMPIYEKRTDRDRQEEARAILSEYWKVDIYDVPRFYQCDWQLMRNERTYAFAEYKWRSYSSTQIDEWGGFKLKLSKYIHGAQLLEWTGVPWLFVADLTDGLFLYKMEEVVQPETIGRFGTTRRGDKNDLEPAIIIPMEEFEDISIKRN